MKTFLKKIGVLGSALDGYKTRQQRFTSKKHMQPRDETEKMTNKTIHT